MANSCPKCNGLGQIEHQRERSGLLRKLRGPEQVLEKCSACNGTGIETRPTIFRSKDLLSIRSDMLPSVEPAEKPWMIGDARVVLAVSSEARAYFLKEDVAPLEVASIMMALDSQPGSHVVQDADGKFRLKPDVRDRVASFRVYSDNREQVIVTDRPLAAGMPVVDFRRVAWTGKDACPYFRATVVSVKLGKK